MTRRRKIVIAFGALVALVVLILVAIHTSKVQRSVVRQLSVAIEEQTGFRVEIEKPRLRLWPARFVAQGLTVSTADREIATVERFEARWRWRKLMGSPRRIDALFIDGLDLEMRDPPPFPEKEPPPEGTAVDPWRALEIGRLEIDGHGGAAGIMDVVGEVEGLHLDAALVDGSASLVVRAAGVALEHFDRRLNLGRTTIRLTASDAGVIVEELELTGGDLGLGASGNLSLSGRETSRADFVLETDVEAALTWWDPNLVTGLAPSGVAELDGYLILYPDGDLELSAVHRGGVLSIAGYDLDELELGFAEGIPEVRVAGQGWGEADVAVDQAGVATINARLRDAPVERLLAFVAPEVAMYVDGPVSLTGAIDGTVAYPFSTDTLSGTVDLEVDTVRGRATLKAAGAGEEWTVSEARVDLAGISIRGSGELGSGGMVDSKVDLRIDDPSSLQPLLAEWSPDAAALGPGGGPITGRFEVAGTLGDPGLEAEIDWENPEFMDHEFEAISVDAEGDTAALAWSAAVITGLGAGLEAEGTADLMRGALEGRWELGVDNLQRTADLVEGLPEMSSELTGNLKGSGGFAYDGAGWSLNGSIEGHEVGMGQWRSERLTAVFDLGPEALEVSKITLHAFSGTVVGAAQVGLEDFDSELSADVEWRGVDLGRVPAQLSALGTGVTEGRLELDGTVSHPTGRVELGWRAKEENVAFPALRMAGALDDGVFTFVTEEVATDAGAFWAEGELPLGVLPRPEWLWPGAPEGALRVSARGHGLQSDAIMEMLGRERPPINATADLELEASWHPQTESQNRVLVELSDLRLHHLGGEVATDRPVVVTLNGNRIELQPVVLSGPQTHIDVFGSADLTTGELDGSIDAVLAPGFARLIPYPIQIHEPISVSAKVGGTMENPLMGLDVRHPGGALVFRDPPLRIRDLVLSAEVVDGVLWINDGRARVNQGTMEIGGGWDPVSRQGMVAEFENVVVFVGGVLSQWSGAVAVEPQPDRLARVVGELNLVAGLWDQNVSLGGALFGSGTLDPTSEDPLNEISLDLDVRGRGIVRVENNLGRFDARWDVLRVTGRAARPRLNGEITIDPGGRFTLAGQRVTVRRGTLLFTGDPDVDPIVEIVPESDFAVFGGDEGQVSTTAMATQGLVEGLAGAFGFENETLQPAEISVEVEKNTSEQLMIGQRLSHNVALFFASNTIDVQDRTSMLQFWNIPGLKGLAVQGYEKTLTEEYGGNVIQRFQWGGSSLYDDRPTIRKLRLNGEWPLKKRRLRKSTGFRRGQPFDPFLQFVAKVRMERELAGEGYQEARVRAESVEANNAWTMDFVCEPGPRQEIVFEGDLPPRRIRAEVTALYQHPPLENFGFRNMRSLLDRHFDVEGYPDAEIVVERRGDLVVAEIQRQGLTELSGPVLEGVPESVAAAVVTRLGKPSELALLAADEERAIRILERVLGDLGYRRATVRSVRVAPTGEEDAEVRAVVDLGTQSVVDELVITGSDPLGLTKAEDFSLKPGSPLDRLSVDLAASQLRAGYDAAGYSDAVVRGSAEEMDDGTWKVTVHLEPGIQRVLEDIVVTGLDHTSRRAIVSGVTVEEGEILRNTDLDTTAVRIANFAPIERVDVQTVPQGSTGARVELDVTEKMRWTTEVGGGWSSERGVQARFGLRDDNLFGRGFGLNLRGRWDQTEWLGFIVASLPPLPGKRLAFSSTIGYSRGEAPDNPELLAQDEAFWSIEATHWFRTGTRVLSNSGEQITGYYRFTNTHVYEKVLDPDAIVTIDITTKTGLIGARYVRDRFDNPFDPTRGHGLIVDAGYSSDILGSDLDYWTSLATGSTAISLFGSSTWVQSVRIGAAEPLGGTNLHPTARFFAGGQGSVRGFDRNTVGPVKFGFGGGSTPAGGGALLIFNEEFRIPVWGGLRAAVFADIGQVWPSWGEATVHMSVGAGVGIRWATPVGPLWADVAWPVVNTGISSTKPKFYVGIGRPF